MLGLQDNLRHAFKASSMAPGRFPAHIDPKGEIGCLQNSLPCQGSKPCREPLPLGAGINPTSVAGNATNDTRSSDLDSNAVLSRRLRYISTAVRALMEMEFRILTISRLTMSCWLWTCREYGRQKFVQCQQLYSPGLPAFPAEYPRPEPPDQNRCLGTRLVLYACQV